MDQLSGLNLALAQTQGLDEVLHLWQKFGGDTEFPNSRPEKERNHLNVSGNPPQMLMGVSWLQRRE